MLEQNERCPKCHTFYWQHGTDDNRTGLFEADGFWCGGCEALDMLEERQADMPKTPGVRNVLYGRRQQDDVT